MSLFQPQSPVAFLERIISASSNEGDVVLDPFCGCGTTIAGAQKLNRQWIGIDITHLSIALQKYRLKDAFGLEPVGTRKRSPDAPVRNEGRFGPNKLNKLPVTSQPGNPRQLRRRNRRLRTRASTLQLRAERILSDSSDRGTLEF